MNIWQTFLDKRGDLLVALGQHIQISLIALVIAVAIAVPLGIWAQGHQRFAQSLLQLTGILQTIPSLALLGLLIPFVGIGTVPAIIALVVYALLPIFQNTYVGLTEIDPAYQEAAAAFGMSRWQKLRKVELPLAMPVIMGGIRTATVLIIGTATLAALIGGGGLGNFILLGINRNDSALTLIGALASAALALLFSAGLALVQKLRFRYVAYALVALVVIGGGAWGVQALRPKPETITVAGKLGSEPEILINMYKELIEAGQDNVKVVLKPNFGQTSFLYSALKSDKIDLYPEFTGTVVTSLVKPTAKQKQALAAGANSYPIANRLLAKQGLVLQKPMRYNNTYALVVRQADAQRYGLKTIADLKKLPQAKAGFDLEFASRSDGYPGIQQAYGLNLAINSLDASLRYQALTKGQVQVTDGYSTDSQIAQYHLLALQDPKHVFATYRGAPLMRTAWAKKHPALVKRLNRLAGKITEEEMQQMNYAVNVKKQSAAKVAKAYLRQHGLLKEAQ
ncbi:MAG: ABC transporter permease/substrate-binding protein [Lactobacillus sp.]|jgi:osmoprotectant transport system permease protein|nr:ABC transporter permease/substrate-binding protein [Lactobacillus sp.]MCI2032156.1 ABC transporter permease/substrate-binding protein [Lactobacillus sp.]